MSNIRKLFETSVDDRVFQKAIEKPKVEIKQDLKIDPFEHLNKREELMDQLRQSYIVKDNTQKLVKFSKDNKAHKISNEKIDPKQVIEEMFRD